MARKSIAASIDALEVGQSVIFDIDRLSTARSTAAVRGAMFGRSYDVRANEAKESVVIRRIQ